MTHLSHDSFISRPQGKYDTRQLSEEETAAVAMALDLYLGDTLHDNESYVITIKRKRQHEIIQIQDQRQRV